MTETAGGGGGAKGFSLPRVASSLTVPLFVVSICLPWSRFVMYFLCTPRFTAWCMSALHLLMYCLLYNPHVSELSGLLGWDNPSKNTVLPPGTLCFGPRMGRLANQRASNKISGVKRTEGERLTKKKGNAYLQFSRTPFSATFSPIFIGPTTGLAFCGLLCSLFCSFCPSLWPASPCPQAAPLFW